MNKRTLKLIWDLNCLYDCLWNSWVKTESNSIEFDDYSKKMKLILKITKNLEEQSRWFLKSKVNYIGWWEYILNNSETEYETLHGKVSKILLSMQ